MRVSAASLPLEQWVACISKFVRTPATSLACVPNAGDRARGGGFNAGGAGFNAGKDISMPEEMPTPLALKLQLQRS